MVFKLPLTATLCLLYQTPYYLTEWRKTHRISNCSCANVLCVSCRAFPRGSEYLYILYLPALPSGNFFYCVILHFHAAVYSHWSNCLMDGHDMPLWQLL